MRAKGVQSFIVDYRGLRSCEQSVHRYFCGIKFADATAISRATTWSEEKDSERLGFGTSPAKSVDLKWLMCGDVVLLTLNAS